MKYIKLAKIASYLDGKGLYSSADLLTNKLIKISQSNEEDTEQVTEAEQPPFELHEGVRENDPDSVMKYFIGFAFDMFVKEPNISKQKINAELEKKISDKIFEMSDENKAKYANLKDQVMMELYQQPWYSSLQESNFTGTNDGMQVQFDPNSSGFSNAIKYILDVEGGYSDYNSATGDPRTNLGIIQSEYDEYRSSKGLEAQSVKNITQDEAEEIYFAEYWIPTKCEQIYKYLPKTAITIFDFAVNSGLGGAASLVANSLGIDNNRFDGSMVDQIIKQGLEIGDDNLSSTLIAKRRINYQDIIRRKPQKAVYGPGWQNRLDKLEAFNQQ